jgi:hypothetical protein
MFEFEEDTLKKIQKRNVDDYDLKLGLAMSNSIKRIVGTQILNPEAIHQRIQDRIKEYFNCYGYTSDHNPSISGSPNQKKSASCL